MRCRPPPPPPAVILSMPQKAAVVLSALSPEQSAEMLRSLSVDEVRAFARASTKLAEIPRETVEETIKEFAETLDKEGLAMTPDKLKRILAGVMSDDQIERIFEDIEESEGRSIWDKLATAEVGDLANFLAREHPQTVSVVISKLRPDKAAKIKMRFEPEFADEVVMRLSKVSQLQANVLDAVKRTLQDDFLKTARQARSKRRPDEMIGSIMNFMSSDKRDTLMKTIEDQSEALAIAVQRKMFTFGDIPKRVERADVSTVVREVDNALLVTALAAAQPNDPETVEFIFNNMSKAFWPSNCARRWKSGRRRATRKAKRRNSGVIDVIRRLADRGGIKLNMGEDEEDEGF